jgi:PE-PPE domain
MKVLARSLVVVFVALIAVPALAVTYTMTSAVQLLAVTALIMGGTEHPLSNPPDTDEFINDYIADAVDNYINPSAAAGTGTAGPVALGDAMPVYYPAQFFPVFGSMTFDDSVDDGRQNLHSCLDASATCNAPDGPTIPADTTEFVVFGYSQSAVVASLVKNDLITDPAETTAHPTSFVLAANAMRPNGGILASGFQGMTIPILGITFYGPTQNSCPSADPCADPEFPTTDIAQQYDLLGGDAPTVPWNVLAWANSGASYALLHGDVPNRTIDGTDPAVIKQGQYGDTTYYMITAPRLPLLMPLEMVGVPGPLLAVVDAPLRVLVEWGHYHGTSPGEHVQFQLLPESDPITMLVNLAGSIPVGIDDGLQQAGLGRALGTPNVYRPFGVGGPTYPQLPSVPPAVTTLDAEPLTAEAARTPEPALAPAPPPTGDTPDPAPETADLQSDAPEGNTPVGGNQPGPLRNLVRLPIQFDRPDRQSASQNGDGPIRRVIKALTGQRPEQSSESEDDDNEAENAAPAA